MLSLLKYDLEDIHEYNPYDESIEVSQSLMGQYFMCEGRVGYKEDPRYVDKPGEKTIYGTVAHHIVEDHFESGGQMILTSQLVSIYLNMALQKDNTSRQELGISEADEAEFVEELLVWYQMFKQSQLAAELEDNVVAMEQRRYLPLGFTQDGMPIVLAGTPDLVVKTSNGFTIKDLKTTSSNKWSSATANMSKQPDVYQALLYAEYKTEGFEFLVWHRGKQEWNRFYTSRTLHDINVTLQQAYLMGLKIHNGVFVPNPIDYNSWTNKRAWYCSPKWCGAWTFCDFKDLHDDKDVEEVPVISWK